MGQGICADCYVGNRKAQEEWRITFGGSGEYPWEIQLRLERQERWLKARKKNRPIPTRTKKPNKSKNP